MTDRPEGPDHDGGFVTVEFLLGCAVLLLPLAAFVFLLPTWAERQSIARTAAREAARTYVVDRDRGAATAVAEQIGHDDELEPGDMTVELDGDPSRRGSTVRAVVDIEVPLVSLPLVRGRAGGFHVTASHVEPVDQYRSFP